MATLQIQDVFEPYYAGKQPAPEHKSIASNDRNGARHSPTQFKIDATAFDAINRRFARTATSAGAKGITAVPLRFDFIVEKLKRRKASAAKLTVVGKAEQPASPLHPAHAPSARTEAPQDGVSVYRARSATTASSTIMPAGVARSRELPTGATSPSLLQHATAAPATARVPDSAS